MRPPLTLVVSLLLPAGGPQAGGWGGGGASRLGVGRVGSRHGLAKKVVAGVACIGTSSLSGSAGWSGQVCRWVARTGAGVVE